MNGSKRENWLKNNYLQRAYLRINYTLTEAPSVRRASNREEMKVSDGMFSVNKPTTRPMIRDAQPWPRIKSSTKSRWPTPIKR